MITPIILAGGLGTRLSPLSTPERPKQFLPLLGERTLLQETALRFADERIAAPLVVCHERHRFLAAEQLRALNIDATMLLEPVSRNTAAAVLSAALHVAETNPEATLFIAPADHHIADNNTFRRAVFAAAELAHENQWVLFGITPTRAETGYGYIERGVALHPSAFAATGFHEKPSSYVAQQLVDGGQHDWNSGMFVARAQFVIEQFQALQPALYEEVERAYKTARADKDFVWLGDDYHACENVPVDIAIMEQSDARVVMPLTLGWSDLGSFASLTSTLSRTSRITRPWGHYTILFTHGERRIKELVIDPHKRTSLQQHDHRSEHWIITRGTASIIRGEEYLVLTPEDQITIPQGCIHRLENQGDEPLHLIEIQTGDILSEDDITRLDDDFGRVSAAQQQVI